MLRGEGRAKVIGVVVTFDLHPEHGPLGIVEESVPGELGVAGGPDDGDAR